MHCVFYVLIFWMSYIYIKKISNIFIAIHVHPKLLKLPAVFQCQKSSASWNSWHIYKQMGAGQMDGLEPLLDSMLST